MRILKFNVSEQLIEKDSSCDFTGIVAGTKGYLQAAFSLSSEWRGCKMAAVFSCLGKEYPVPVIRERCDIPDEALKWYSFGVRLVGEKEGYRITTNEIKVRQERR